MKLLLAGFGLAVYLWPQAWALDIDEKLTSRILRVSSSQHTILLNRGLEDGLVLGDHAKFFLPEGVIARGVVVKASPMRSVWSLYRLINPNLIKPDTVVELKIASPVQLTSDPSKAFERASGPGDVLTAAPARAVTAVPGVNMGVPSSGEGENLTASDQEDLAELGIKANPVNQVHKNELPSSAPLADHLWELWAGGFYSTMSVKETNSMERFSYKTAPSFAFGGERYFKEGAWRRWSFSLFGQIYNSQKTVINLLQNETYENFTTNYDSQMIHGMVGANYHFWNEPHATYQFIGFGFLNAGLGKARDYVQVNTIDKKLWNGNAYFGALGVGLKFYTDYGAGARLTFDYYYGHHVYNFNDDVPSVEQDFSGIRWMLAGVYRF